MGNIGAFVDLMRAGLKAEASSVKLPIANGPESAEIRYCWKVVG